MAIINGSVTGNGAEVSAALQLKVVTETDVANNAANVGAIRNFSQNDSGSLTGVVLLASPEVDIDNRERVSLDLILDDEFFYYTAQNTGKHTYSNTTMTNAWTAGQLTTNSGSITTITTGTVFATYAAFPLVGTTTVSADTTVAFSAQPVTNTFIEWGLGIPGAQTVAPTDGVFFRLNSAGLQGIVSSNGSETSTGVFPLSGGTGTWVYTNNKRYQFTVYVTGIQAEFWVTDGSYGEKLLGVIPLPSAQGRLTLATAAQYFFKHRIVGGAAGGVLQALVGAYSVKSGGASQPTIPGTQGNRVYGSYQGLSGGTMGSLANYANSANPTAAVPTNTTAALGTGLGGQFWETFSLAVNTDGIICSYQVPAGTVLIPGRRLVIRGVGLSSYVQTVLAGGPCNTQYSLAFGHTSVSLATAESATAKAPRRVPLAGLTQTVTAAQAVSTVIAQVSPYQDFGDAPVFVNPGEFVALVAKHVGTVGTSGTIAHVVTFAYGWE